MIPTAMVYWYIKHLTMCPKSYAKRFIHSTYFYPHNYPKNWVLLLFPVTQIFKMQKTHTLNKQLKCRKSQ